jgi:hypothetical protein
MLVILSHCLREIDRFMFPPLKGVQRVRIGVD